MHADMKSPVHGPQESACVVGTRRRSEEGDRPGKGGETLAGPKGSAAPTALASHLLVHYSCICTTRTRAFAPASTRFSVVAGAFAPLELGRDLRADSSARSPPAFRLSATAKTRVIILHEWTRPTFNGSASAPHWPRQMWARLCCYLVCLLCRCGFLPYLYFDRPDHRISPFLRAHFINATSSTVSTISL